MFEPLEDRIVLNASPILTGLPEVIYLTPGTSYHVALNGEDADGDRLSFTASTNSSLLNAYVLEGNKSVEFSVYQEKTGGKEDWELVGTMIMELFQKEAPETTQRFMDIINGYEKGGTTYTYNGVPIHRIIDGFMFQGGDVEHKGGTGGTGDKFQDEYHALLQHSSRGIVSTANAGANTNDSQFFITDVATPHLNNKHNVFGFITQGDDVRDKVNSIPTWRDYYYSEYGNLCFLYACADYYNISVDSIPASDYQDIYNWYYGNGIFDAPINAVKTDNFRIFDDYENGTLRLVVPENASPGESQVTVYVSDGVNAPVPYTFTVKVIEETTTNPTWNIPGYFDLVSGIPYTFTLPEYPFPGEVEYIVEYLPTTNGDPNIEIIRNGRDVTIIPPAIGGGLTWIYVQAVAKDTSSSSDPYEVALFIAPSAPQIKLSPQADTGTAGDNITSRNNDKAGNELIFEVSNVVEGASVSIYREGYEVSLNADVNRVRQENGLWTLFIKLSTGAYTTLADGTYQFAARQIFEERYGHPAMESQISQQITVVIDTKGPVFTKPSGQTLFDAKVGEKLEIEFATQSQAAIQTKYTIASVKNSLGETITVPSGVQLTENGFFTWTPTTGQVDEYTFEIKATSGSGLSSTLSIEIAFQNGPEYTITGNTTVIEGEVIVLELALTDPDYEGDVVFSLKPGSLPAGVNYTLVQTGNTAVFTWQTTKADGRQTYNPEFIVTDENGDARRKNVVLTVNALETPPYFTNVFQSLYNGKEYEKFELQLVAKDDDIYPGETNPLTFSIESVPPPGMTINPQTGLIQWTPGEAQGLFSYDVTVRVTDKTGLFEEKVLHFYIEKVDRPPVFEAGNDLFKNQYTGTPFATQVIARDPDYIVNPAIPINQVVYMLEGDEIPDGMTINPQTGVLIWSIPVDYLGSVMFGTVTVKVVAQEITDSGQLGLTSSKTITIELTNRRILDVINNPGSQGPTDPNEAIMQKLFGELGASHYSFLSQGYLGLFPGRQLFQYVPSFDYGHTSYHGFGGSLRPYSLGGEGSKGGNSLLEKEEEEENSDSTTRVEETPPQRSANLIRWDDNFDENLDSYPEENTLDKDEWIQQVAWDIASPSTGELEWNAEETPEMEDAITLLATVL